MTSRAAYCLALAIVLLALAVGFHACRVGRWERTSQRLHQVLREIQEAGLGGPEAP